MAIGTCRACQSKVDETATSCPHCGAKLPNIKFIIKRLRDISKKTNDTVIGIIIVLIVTYIGLSVLFTLIQLCSKIID